MGATIVGSSFGLSGGNQIWLSIEWNEKISGNTNTITARMYANTKYRINGTWPCRIVIDGETFGPYRTLIQHGSNSRTLIRTVTKTFTYSGNKTISMSAYIDNMDYMDIHSGKWYYGTISATGSRTLSNVNRPPSTPNGVICLDPVYNGFHIAENTIRLEIGASNDPDGNSITYGIFGQALKPGHSSWEPMGDSNSCVHWSPTRRADVGISGYERGTQFRFYGRAVDSNNTNSGDTSWSNLVRRNRYPETISQIFPSERNFTDSITISWTAPIEHDGQSVYYNVYLSKNDGDYNKVSPRQSATSFTENIRGDLDNTTYKFKVIPTDGMCEGYETFSPKYTKKITPTTPTNISPSSGYFHESVVISWGESHSPDGQPIFRYNVFINDVKVGSTSNTNYMWIIPSGDAEKQRYKASVEAELATGAKSDIGYASGYFYKAETPAMPREFLPTEEFHEKNMNLSWTYVSVNDREASYNLELNHNNTWTVLKNGPGNYFLFDIEKIPRGDSFQFAVQATDGQNLSSQWLYSRWYKRNRIPTPVRIDYPIDNSIIYDRTPRIAFNAICDGDSHGQFVSVLCNDVSYNSIDNPEMFSFKDGILHEDTKIVFTCPEMPLGKNTVKISSKDGFNEVSNNVSFTIENVPNISYFAEAAEINDIKRAINKVRNAYGLHDYISKDVVANSTYISTDIFEKMRIAIEEIKNRINYYDIDNPDKNITSWNTTIEKDNFIELRAIEEIVDSLKNI